MERIRDVRKILVMNLLHIGDVLLTTPLLGTLRHRFPEAQIDALVSSGSEEVLVGNRDLNEVVVFDRGIKRRGVFGRMAAEVSFLRSMRARAYDMTVDLTSRDRQALLSLMAGRRYRLGYDPEGKGLMGKRHIYTHRALKDGSQHMVLQHLALLEAFGIEASSYAVRVHIPEDARASVRRRLEAAAPPGCAPLVHVHPVARWLFKCWRDEAMAGVIAWLAREGACVVVTSSPLRKEMERVSGILARARDGLGRGEAAHILDLSGRTSIKEVAAVAEMADAFFGVDTAPMHIAAAVDTPVVALFGPTGSVQWGPWDNEGMSPGRHAVIQRSWDCVPCHRDGCDGTKISRCLDDISEEEVKRVLTARLFPSRGRSHAAARQRPQAE